MKARLFLSMILALLLGSMVAYAGEATITEGQIQNSGFYDYIVLEDNTVEIVFYHGDESKLYIPSEIDGRPVSSIGAGAFLRCSFLDSVIIPAPVKNIGAYAFAECGLSSVILPDTLLNIGNESFSWCLSLNSITIPESVILIGSNPFSYCMELNEIIVSPNSNFAIVDGVLFDKENHRLIYYPCANKNSSYSIPDGIQYIGDKAFVSCRLLKEITIPDTITDIGDSAFYDCTSLTHLELSDSIVSIGDDAFSWCTSLANIALSDSLTDIGNYAFYNCQSLQNINLPNSVSNIGDGAFSWCSSLKSIAIPDSVICIGSNPFSYCDTLTEISVSSDSNFAVISGVLFDKNNKRLICYPYAYSDSNYIIPEGIMIIGEEAFAGSQLSTIVLPESIVAIEDNAFSYCNSLDDLKIPFSVTNIADNAFAECNALTLIVSQGSHAEEYAISKEMDYVLSDENDQQEAGDMGNVISQPFDEQDLLGTWYITEAVYQGKTYSFESFLRDVIGNPVKESTDADWETNAITFYDDNMAQLQWLSFSVNGEGSWYIQDNTVTIEYTEFLLQCSIVDGQMIVYSDALYLQFDKKDYITLVLTKQGTTLPRIDYAMRAELDDIEVDRLTVSDDGIYRYIANGKVGYFDREGLISPAKWQNGDLPSEGLITVKINDKWGVINYDGEFVSNPIWDVVYPYREGLACVVQGDVYGFIDTDGNIVIEPQYEITLELGLDYYVDYEHGFFYDGLALTTDGTFIDTSGNTVWGDDSFRVQGLFKNGYAPVRSDDGYGIIDQTGQMVVSAEWDGVGEVSEGMVSVKRDGKWGFINLEGEIIIATQWDSVEPFSEGVAMVEHGGFYMYLDNQGRPISNTTWDDARSFSEGLGLVYDAETELYGYVNAQGEVAIYPCYTYAENFSDGLALVKWEGDYIFINKEGRQAFDLTFERLPDSFENGYASTEFGVIDTNGNIVSRVPSVEIYLSGYWPWWAGTWMVVEANGNILW